MSEKKIIATRIAIFQNGRRNKTHEAKLPFYIGNAVIKKPWQTGNNVRHWATRTLFCVQSITHHLYMCVCLCVIVVARLKTMRVRNADVIIQALIYSHSQKQ